MVEINIYSDPKNPRSYRFADGPNEGRMAFTLDGKLHKGGIFPYSKSPTQVMFHAFRLIDAPYPANTVIVKASCGQEVTVDLEEIDENQDISEVTIRGVTYVPK